MFIVLMVVVFFVATFPQCLTQGSQETLTLRITERAKIFMTQRTKFISDSIENGKNMYNMVITEVINVKI